MDLNAIKKRLNDMQSQANNQGGQKISLYRNEILLWDWKQTSNGFPLKLG